MSLPEENQSGAATEYGHIEKEFCLQLKEQY